MNVGSGTKQNAHVYNMYILLYNIVYILYYYRHIHILLYIYIYIVRDICIYY